MSSDQLLIKFSPADTAIAEMRSMYMDLTVDGIDDKEGLKVVHEARMTVKSHRVAVEKKRVELKKDALEFGRKVDAEAKRLTALLEPIETHLATEEQRIDDEKEAIRNLARMKAEAEERAKREAEEARIRAEQEAKAAAMRAEQERLDAERKALEAERAQIEAEKRRIAEEAAARQRAIDTEERKRREAEEAERRKVAEAEEERRRKAEARRIRAEQFRPDREKLTRFADAVESLEVPQLGEGRAEIVRSVLRDAAGNIRKLAATLE